MTLHDKDLTLWAEVQSCLLRNGLYDQLDTTHLFEELDNVSKSDQHALYSYLVVAITHLLKLAYQPEKECNYWHASLCNATGGIRKILKRHPSYQRFLAEDVDDAYDVARLNAHYETGLPLDTFPKYNFYPTTTFTQKLKEYNT